MPESYILLLLSFLLFLGQVLFFFQTRRVVARFPRSSDTVAAVSDQILRRLEEQIRAVRRDNAELRAQLATCVRSPALLRFSAFRDVGGDLSFSLALLDQKGDGVVLSSLYGRKESRVFAKPVRGGSSSYRLSEEEERAIGMAMGKGENAGRDEPRV
ncbi:MAG: DUF4446 family protein [Firmicutes bacterium]|nr:DUF4446 family protein [Bacillota bacterium]